MKKLTTAILGLSLELVTLGLMAGGPSARKDVQVVKTLNVTNAADIVMRWCRRPDAFVRVEELAIPMQIGPIPDDVQSACRILASQNPEVLLAAYSVLILRDYEYRFRDFSRCQYPPTHIGPVASWEIAGWTLKRLGLLGAAKGSDMIATVNYHRNGIIRLLQLLQWEPKSPAYLRTTLGMASREYFTKAYLRPLMEAGLIERGDPDHPHSPQQKYVLAKEGKKRIERVAPL